MTDNAVPATTDHARLKQIVELQDQLTALRKRIRALADECEKVPPANEAMNAWQRAHAAFARELRELLGDDHD